MSGHSKWSKVKHQKAVTDVTKGKFFTKAAHAIAIAVQEGGGTIDPAMNFKLRLAIEKARSVNMPKENIERAIARGKGDGGATIETILYEGFGPGGIGLLIEAATDNKQRTVSEIRNVLDRAGGSLGSLGSVGYLFSKVGLIIIPKEGYSYDAILEKALSVPGILDVVEEQDGYVLFTHIEALSSVKDFLDKGGLPITHTDIVYRPIAAIALSASDKGKLAEVLGALEDLDDVQRVFTAAEEV